MNGLPELNFSENEKAKGLIHPRNSKELILMLYILSSASIGGNHSQATGATMGLQLIGMFKLPKFVLLKR